MRFRPLVITFAAVLVTGSAVAQNSAARADAGQTSDAVSAQREVPVEKPPLTPEVRGDIFMARKQYREAIDAFRQGPQNDPVLWNKMGIAYHQMVQLDTAMKDYQQAVKLKKNYVEAINNIGTVYYARKNFRRAITYYLRAIKLSPEKARCASFYSNLGAAYAGRKDYVSAAEAVKTAVSLDPDIFEHQGGYGVLLEDHNVADRYKWHYLLAKTYALEGRTELALQTLRKALEEGLKDKKQLEKDPEFASIRDTQEFKDLLALEPRVL